MTTPDGQLTLGQCAGKESGGTGDTRPDEEAAIVAGDAGQHVSDVIDTDEVRFPDPDGTVEIAVTQVDYTIEGAGRDEYPVLHIFGRTADNETEHVRVLGFRPYFYAPTDSLDDELLDKDVITGTEPGYESIRGEELTKIFGRTPRDVGQIRDEFDHYEADILFPNRLLIDKDINDGVRVPARRLDDGTIQIPHQEIEPTSVEADLRVNTFDIEVNDRNGFPEDGEEPIICLTSHDSYRDEYIVWHAVAPDGEGKRPDSLPGYDYLRDGSAVEVRTFDEEDAMLDAFVSYLEKTDPDIFTGWNCLPEDTRVLLADGTERKICDVEVGDTVVGSDNQQTTVAEVTNTWESKKEVKEFELADGTTLQTSDEHRIMVGDDEAVDWKEGRDVQVGDYVLKPRKLRVDDIRVPTLADLVPDHCQRFTDQDSVKAFKKHLPYGAVSELSDEFGVAKGTHYHPHTDTWTPERCEQAAERYDIPMPDGGRSYRRTGVDLDRELTAHELYLAGLVLTDGTMSEDDGIRFYNTRTELHDQFPGGNSLTADGKGCFKQGVLDYATMHAFNGLGIPFGDKNAGEVDLSTIYRLPERYIAQFLAGVIDGDGCISSSVTIAAENKSIGKWYVRLLQRLGVYAQQREHIVRIPDSAREIDRLKQFVLPHMSHPEKVGRLAAFEGGQSGATENIPYALFDAATGTDEKRIGNDKWRRGINLKRYETKADDWEEYVFVEVTDISRVGVETTYDLETTTHNFVAEDCLVHNCDDFDIPYFLDRLDVLNPTSDYDLDYNRMSRLGEVWRGGWGGPDIKGRVVFDLLYAYKRTQFTELESYRLDAVGELELDVGKERYSGDIGDLWEQDPERLLEYNLRDVELCVEIDRKQDIIAFWDEVRTFVGCKLEDAPTPGDTVDIYVLHKVHGEFALPSKGKQESEDYEGGAVFDPITGVKENVTVLDLKSLYPMCMVTINASPETKVDPESYDGDMFRAPNGTHFQQEPDGMIREMVDELLTEREEKKALRNEHDPGSSEYGQFDRQQQAVKVIMNSLYGVLGWDRFRLYDKEMGAAVTATGREVIEFTEQAANEIGYEVAYGDTDSVMLELGPDVSTEEAIEQSFEIEEHINAAYDDFAQEALDAGEHRFQIEFEKLYRRFFQAGKKKRYAGHIVWKEGKDVDDIDITGFEYKRSDIAQITKEVQKNVIDMIVHGQDTEDIKEYLHDIITDFQSGNLPLEEAGIPGGIGKRLTAYETPTAHVRGAQYANAFLGTNFGRGSKPKRVYLKKVHPSWFRKLEDGDFDPQMDDLYRDFKRDPDVICFEYADQIPDEFEVDWDTMLDKTLQGPISRVIEALGMSWDEVKSGQEQTGLGSFM
ncbi:DNA polymerase [Haloferax mediterranei ATCC 33500]|uniref:DNA polymerase n=1 Tax=Haloferax mediterranei (strain ATCC 33500 / DSM 1411 / JCM 8866 / NBRC 14739 / NCIMB 2177 / R-4) TaxID=523841 RepID=I3R2T8_HALMT|nr:DNA polymerase domain-containing protein [Haloferax mediterranei]AFK18548.1 DNA polymerase I [Haloferax mediterranei ATCC 33500]AHZ22074.1 DNA polymerase [Haloferax mediterranei ATCC 33500]EMA02177.1 DNA polymerase I [Haloferax mediterranei ATCC 33500]MDX5988639.1 DNA polymerase domain-containing protein [Haloferax mediterranei ATCC 33500]QCQ75053.1 DNA polymerase [Haloferax mediterranei ATCC 33500]